jgi:hypothetical protein
MDTTPKDFYIEQWRFMRERENTWEYVREVMAMVHNASPNAKRSIKGRQIIELEKDKKTVDWEVDDEWARKALKNLN